MIKNQRVIILQDYLFIIFILCGTLIFHTLALENAYYFYLSWADILTHFTTGFAIGMFFMILFKKIKYILPAAIFVVLSWELFELFAGISVVFISPDFLLDVFIGFVAIFGGAFYHKKRIKST